MIYTLKTNIDRIHQKYSTEEHKDDPIEIARELSKASNRAFEIDNLMLTHISRFYNCLPAEREAQIRLLVDEGRAAAAVVAELEEKIKPHLDDSYVQTILRSHSERKSAGVDEF